MSLRRECEQEGSHGKAQTTPYQHQAFDHSTDFPTYFCPSPIVLMCALFLHPLLSWVHPSVDPDSLPSLVTRKAQH